MMELKSICGVLLLVLLSMTITGINAFKVGFGEADYRAYEYKGGVKITVQLSGRIYGSVPLTVQTHTYDEVEGSKRLKFSMGEELPDPAEYKIEGRQDFVKETFSHTFYKSREEQEFFIRFNDDEVDEKQEGFFVELKVDESQLHPKDLENMEYIRHGIALIRIEDNDEIKLAFEKRAYNVSESAGVQSDLIAVVKEDNRKTEKTLEIMIQEFPVTAKRGDDYNMPPILNITFAPEEQIKYITFEVMKDSNVEMTESFNLILSVPENTELYSIGTNWRATVYISDVNETDNCSNQDIYFLIDTTLSNNRLAFCQTHYGVELMITAINPGGDLSDTRMGSILYPNNPRNDTPVAYNFFDIGTDCSEIINDKYDKLVDAFYNQEFVDNPYQDYVRGEVTHPVETITKLIEQIKQSIADGEPMERRRTVVVLTDGNNDGELDELRQAVSELVTVAPDVMIIAAGNDDAFRNEAILQDRFKEELKVIANGVMDNVVIGHDPLNLIIGLVEKMQNVGAICLKEANQTLSKLKEDNSKAYCYCIDSRGPLAGNTAKTLCKRYCKTPLMPRDCRAPPTCNIVSSSPSSIRETRGSEMLDAVKVLHDMVMK